MWRAVVVGCRGATRRPAMAHIPHQHSHRFSAMVSPTSENKNENAQGGGARSQGEQDRIVLAPASSTACPDAPSWSPHLLSLSLSLSLTHYFPSPTQHRRRRSSLAGLGVLPPGRGAVGYGGHSRIRDRPPSRAGAASPAGGSGCREPRLRHPGVHPPRPRPQKLWCPARNGLGPSEPRDQTLFEESTAGK